MQHEAKINQIQIVEADTFRYYASPINPILRELAPLMPDASPGEIAAKIDYKTSAAEDSESLRFLEKSRMLQKNGDVYEQTAKTIKGSKEAIPLAIRSMNREMAPMAADSLEKHNSAEMRRHSLLRQLKNRRNTIRRQRGDAHPHRALRMQQLRMEQPHQYN